MKKSKKRFTHYQFITRYFPIVASLLFTGKIFSQPCTPPSASIVPVSPSVCQGSPVYLQLNAATGQGPYTVSIGGNTFSNINVGDQIGPLSTTNTSIWNASNVPVNPDSYDGQSIEVGTKFRSSVNGYITGIKFYKGTTNTGLHIASLWTSAGTKLATANFVSESASGWQEVRFPSPVQIFANTTYIASYYSQSGVYALTAGYFLSQGATNGPVTALQSGVDGANGVYRYGNGFPTNSFNNNNYWVDVLFAESINGYTANYSLTSIIDANGCSNSGNISSASITVNPLPAGTLSTVQASVCPGQQINLNFNASSGTGPFSIVTNAITNNNVNSNQPFSSNINAAQPAPAPISIWSSAPATNIVPVVSDNSAVELGVKFRSAVYGHVTGIRFYKRVQNTGIHTGSLWSSNGTLLGTATFTSETASGWQTVTFSTPIAITANQTFIASYFSPAGQYAYTPDYFTGVSTTNGPLTAVDGNGPYGPNGLFAYGGGFPAASFANTNYWVDVIFTPNQGFNVINMTQIMDANGCTTTASPIQSLNIASAECIALPVTLTDFHLSVQQKKVQLVWQTSSENNNAGFDVQRSVNNINWQTLGFVKGAGNSSVTQYYSYADAELATGKYYYRLKQLDLDNKFTFSKVLTAEIKGSAQNYLGQNYPNPAVQQQATINYGIASQSLVNISLYDVQGRMIKVLLNETKASGQYTLNANLSLLAPGTYYYKMRTGDFTETKKLMIGYR